MTIKLEINGKIEDVSGEITVRELLREKEVEDPDMVSVKLNGTILERATYDTVQVLENDEVEFLYFMGGGSHK
ncbi:MAG: sulfur carrier protein ThiS [Syntrophales bacterium]